MANNQEQVEPSMIADSLPHFGLTIPVKYYIPEPCLESEEMDEDTMQSEYEALSPALQKVF